MGMNYSTIPQNYQPGGQGNGASGVGVPPGGIALNGPVDVVVQKPGPGMPPGVTPPVMIRPRQPAPTQALPQPLPATPQVAGVPYAQTFPMASPGAGGLAPIADIPPPHMVAPWLYLPQRSFFPGQAPLSNSQSNVYNNYPGGYPGQPPVPAPPVQPPAPMQTPPPVNQPPAAATPPTPAQNPPQSPLNPGGAPGLDDVTVRGINQRLADPSPMVRSDAAMHLYKILESNPALAQDPQYMPYVDAFLVKILKDPSPLVRHPVLLAFEMGLVKNPSPQVRDLLVGLTGKGGLYNIEPQVVQGILGQLNNPLPPVQPGVQPVAPTGAPLAAPAAAIPPGTAAEDPLAAMLASAGAGGASGPGGENPLAALLANAGAAGVPAPGVPAAAGAAAAPHFNGKTSNQQAGGRLNLVSSPGVPIVGNPKKSKRG